MHNRTPQSNRPAHQHKMFRQTCSPVKTKKQKDDHLVFLNYINNKFIEIRNDNNQPFLCTDPKHVEKAKQYARLHFSHLMRKSQIDRYVMNRKKAAERIHRIQKRKHKRDRRDQMQNTRPVDPHSQFFAHINENPREAEPLPINLNMS